MQTMNVTAPDISCDHCRATIERELGSVSGVEHVAVDVPTGRVEVTYDPAQITEADIVAKLEDEGYPPTSA